MVSMYVTPFSLPLFHLLTVITIYHDTSMNLSYCPEGGGGGGGGE